jgi:aminoglycoside phosphotransferase (APT) family kinase protein
VKLLASGRASEILDLGDGRVLRRFKSGGDPVREAEVMAHAAGHGYPVPRVYEVHDDALVLERVDGPTMKADVFRRPWRLAAHARTLGQLHRELHRIPFGDGVLLHLDLHPENVLMAAGGPIVVDWTNARAGAAELDPALTWVILMTSGGPAGRLFARSFARHVDVRSELAEAAAFRLDDPNVSERERAAVRRLLASQYD